jgi:hypothetical protein
MLRLNRKDLVGASALAAFVLYASASAAQGVSIGNWIVSENYDGHGASHATGIVTSVDGASLVASCSPQGLSVFLSYLTPVSSSDALRVRWRLDQGALHDQTWTSNGDRGTFSSEPAQPARALLKQLSAAHTLTVSAGGKRDVFALEGVRQVAALIGACPARSAAGGSSGGSADTRP